MHPNPKQATAFVWQQIIEETQTAVAEEPILKEFLSNAILNRQSMGEALSYHLAAKLSSSALSEIALKSLMNDVFAHDEILYAASRDIQATVDRDSACTCYSTPFLYFKGYLALQAYRVAHLLWHRGNRPMALMLQHSTSLKFAVDIHPAARIGSGILIDHGTGLVIGETAHVEDCVSMMQSVTLGGTGKESGDRHPKIRKGVLLGPGAKVLGNIEIGEGAMVAASSVVLKPVPARTIVAGVPAAVVGEVSSREPSRVMDHYFSSC
jgi:serine O-acetyltransferase